jgi:hypothetical protein
MMKNKRKIVKRKETGKGELVKEGRKQEKKRKRDDIPYREWHEPDCNFDVVEGAAR